MGWRGRESGIEDTVVFAEALEQFLDGVEADAGGAAGGGADLEHGRAGYGGDAEIREGKGFDGASAGFHEAGEGDVAGFIEAEVGGDDGGELDGDDFETAVGFAGTDGLGGGVRELDFGDESGLGPSEAGGEHGADLAGIVIDRLFAHEDELGLFATDDGGEDKGDGGWVEEAGVFDAEGAIDAHGQNGAKLVFGGGGGDGDGDDFGGFGAFADSEGLLDGDFIEVIDDPLFGAGGGGVGDTFERDEDFHGEGGGIGQRGPSGFGPIGA